MLLAPQVRDYVNAHYHTKVNDVQLARIVNLYTWDEDPPPSSISSRTPPPAGSRKATPTGTTSSPPPSNAAYAHQRAARTLHPHLRLRTPHRHRPRHLRHPLPHQHHARSSHRHRPPTQRRRLHHHQAAGLHFGPSERFTADLANPDNPTPTSPTGESGNPASPNFLDQFQPWLQAPPSSFP